jgi:hypothetical protein
MFGFKTFTGKSAMRYADNFIAHKATKGQVWEYLECTGTFVRLKRRKSKEDGTFKADKTWW